MAEAYSKEELVEMNKPHEPFTDDEIDTFFPTRQSLISMIQKALECDDRYLATIAARDATIASLVEAAEPIVKRLEYRFSNYPDANQIDVKEVEALAAAVGRAKKEGK
jgi:hypothetical protein